LRQLSNCALLTTLGRRSSLCAEEQSNLTKECTLLQCRDQVVLLELISNYDIDFTLSEYIEIRGLLALFENVVFWHVSSDLNVLYHKISYLRLAFKDVNFLDDAQKQMLCYLVP
jgi:hypothetical protein